MVDVFISYPRTERARVEPIRDILENLGLEVFFDVYGIDGGANFPDVIDRALRACKAVLSCWSPLYFERRWCMIECRVGLDKDVLVPVAIQKFDNDAPPADLRFVNFFDLTDWRGQVQHEGWLRTLHALSRLVGRDLTSPALQGVAHSGGIIEPKLVRLPRGRFEMGSPANDPYWQEEEGPQHCLRIDYEFLVGKYPVTFAEWDAAVAAGLVWESNDDDLNDFVVADDEGWGRENRPVINICPDHVNAYIEFLNSKCGLIGRPDRYRLLSEAEWEYACRAGTATRYSFGDDINVSLASFGRAGRTVPVGSFPPNEFGLHDMHGNVSELCQDSFHHNYVGAPSDGSAWIDGGFDRIYRGGSWADDARNLRSASRRSDFGSDSSFGFRLARRG